MKLAFVYGNDQRFITNEVSPKLASHGDDHEAVEVQE